MASEIRAGASFELSTSGMAPKMGLASLRDLFDSKVQLQFDADPDQHVKALMTVYGLPGVRYATMQSDMTVSLSRHQQRLSDDEDDLCLIVNTGDALWIEQRGQRVVAGPGDAVLLDYREPARLGFQTMSYAAVRVPRAALAPLARQIPSRAGAHIRRDSNALALLRCYLDSLPQGISDPQLRGLVATHVYDLMALAIGASTEGAEVATQRGLKAARRQAIKAALTREPDLSIGQIAERQSVSPRYVQKLFEETGTTFTEFVLALRLDTARAMLTSPRYRHWKITAIALEAGFGDLSHFNRSFKARFAETPSDARNRGDMVPGPGGL
jgi:AraC-like DNA-binding protein